MGCVKEEPGTLRFDVLRPKKLASQVMLHEECLEEAAFQVDWHGASVSHLRSESTDMIAKLDGVPCASLEKQTQAAPGRQIPAQRSP
jgi:quinol monooxygenase YgiN